ncbi:cbb3-type cytochrome c oxidase N-terminal domain-containing protein [Mucilaginibacter antarcticus]|uniref:cbb3-type cytochrome c oxidase N-terminal domain-containing protein n=1 Tax=Mucilaginibacter antarcticus TaxID=1855725 RepID=UPI0036417C62
MALIFVLTPAYAADDSLTSADTKNYIGLGVIVWALLLLLVVLLVLLRTFKILTRIILKSDGYTDAEIIAEMAPVKAAKKPTQPKKEFWNKVLSLRPLAEEKDMLIEHEYDGIKELDNPTPAWFMVLFYSTIIFAVGYLLIYHVFGIGQLQYDEYKTEVAQAEVVKKQYLSKAANLIDENTVKLLTEPGTIKAGEGIFKQNCAACHGDKGQGVVGPNLTDDYWLHGGSIKAVFKTIKYGIAAKGMPTWEKQLSPKQLSDVSNYVKTLHGTNPPNGKEPQGEKEEEKLASN